MIKVITYFNIDSVTMFERIHGLIFYILPTILMLVGLRKYRASKWGKCENSVDLSGKVIIVTGANSGIGFEVAKNLASRNGQVILACRSVEKANAAIIRIKQHLSNCSALVITLSLEYQQISKVKL